MKRFIKIASLVLAVVLSAFVLSSCRKLDDMKARQAFYTDDTETAITFDGHEYKILDTGKLSFVYSDNMYKWEGYVTQKDVPVLLSWVEGDGFGFNEDQSVIGLWYGDKSYVKDDKYEEYKEILDNAELDHFYFSYMYYPEDYEEYRENEYKNVLLDDELTDIVRKTLSIPDKEKISYKELRQDNYAHKVIRLQYCDKDMVVTNDYGVSLFREGTDYYIWNENTYDEYSICPISEEDYDAVKELFRKYSEAGEEYNIRYYFDNNYYNTYYDQANGYNNSDGHKEGV